MSLFIVALCGCGSSAPNLPPPPKPSGLARMDRDVVTLIRTALRQTTADPTDVASRLRLGMIYEANGLFAEAITCYGQTHAADPESHRPLVRLAIAQSAAGRIDAAINAALEARAIEPVPALLGRLALWELSRGDADAAAEYLAAAETAAPGDEAALHARVLLLLENDQPQAALGFIERKGLVESLNGIFARQLQARAQRALGETISPIETPPGSRPQWADPDRAELDRFVVGVVAKRREARRLRAERRFEEASRLLEQLRASAPEDLQVLHALAMSYFEMREHERTLEVLGDADDLDPGNPTTDVLVARTLLAMAPTDAALLPVGLERIEAALARRPDDREAHLVHGQTLVALGRKSDAADAYRSAFDVDGRDPSPLDQAGLIELELGRPDAAALCFERSIRVDANRATPLAGLALVSLQRGDRRAANNYLAAARTRRVEHPAFIEMVVRDVEAANSKTP